ncbi:MAG: peptidylprolyl isomerase [Pseudomonadota bacterium]|nr:peptidylprolyl isomerase [Pseudomonadota bacterium]
MRPATFLLCRSTIAATLAALSLAAVQPACAQAAAPAAGAKRAAPVTVDAIVAVVNSDIITRQELDERVRSVEARIKQQGTALPARPLLEKQVLERMIIDRAQLQLAADNGIKVDDLMLDRAMARLAEQNKLTPADFRRQLEREGMSYPHFREEIRDEITMQRIREREVDNKLQITESEVDNFIAAEKSAPAAQPELNVAQILIRIPENASAEQIAARKSRAEDVAQQLRSGADFAKMAASYSDSVDALKGGELGYRTPDRLPQLFVDAVAQLKQGEVSQVVKSPNGFHILKLVGRRVPSVVREGAGNTAAAPAVQQTHARHILIKVNQIVTAAEAQRKLTDLKQRLDNKSATFEELAKLYSNDLSASKGGDLGWIYPGDTAPEFEQAMNALKPGQISAPIETPFGYHLIQVLERKSQDVSNERQRLLARQAIRERKLDEATQDWIRQLRDRAYVELRNEDK